MVCNNFCKTIYIYIFIFMYVWCLVAQSCPTHCDTLDCSPLGSSKGFFRQESLSGLSFPPLGDLPNMGIKSASPALDSLTRWASREALFVCVYTYKTYKTRENIFDYTYIKIETKKKIGVIYWGWQSIQVGDRWNGDFSSFKSCDILTVF